MNRGQFFKTVIFGILGVKQIIANAEKPTVKGIVVKDEHVTEKQVAMFGRQTGKYFIATNAISWYCVIKGTEYGNTIIIPNDVSIDSGFNLIKKDFLHWYSDIMPRVPNVDTVKFSLYKKTPYIQELVEVIELKEVSVNYIKKLKFSKEDELI